MSRDRVAPWVRSGDATGPASRAASGRANVGRRADWLPRFLRPTLYGLGSSVRDWAIAILNECGSDELLVLVARSVGRALRRWRAPPPQSGPWCRSRGRQAECPTGSSSSRRGDPVLRSDGVSAAWNRYWAPLFSTQTRPEVVAACKTLALQHDVDDLITGVQAFYDRRDQSEFVKSWKGHLLVVSGADDRTPTPATAAREIAGTKARHMIVESAGHYVPLEQPELFQCVLSNKAGSRRSDHSTTMRDARRATQQRERCSGC